MEKKIETLNYTKIYQHGEKNFIAGMCRKLQIGSIINKELYKDKNNSCELSYGTQAEIMLVNICDNNFPLWRLKDYYRNDDLEGIFHTRIALDQLEDELFIKFLNKFYHAGCKKIFSEICRNIFLKYDIHIKNLDFNIRARHNLNKAILNQENNQRNLKERSSLMLINIDRKLRGQEILIEYKTQYHIEKRFGSLKSYEFVSPLYLKTSECIEALGYLMLIALTLLSVCEYVVRRESKRNNEIGIDFEEVKTKRLDLSFIIDLMKNIPYKTLIDEDGNVLYRILEKFEDIHRKVLYYLGLDQSIFIK